MSLYSTAVKKPVSTIMIFIGVVIFGIFSYLQLPVDYFPQIDPPIISVFTYYNGANATDIEQNITRKLEDGFGSLNNLKKISSSSKDNISVVTLEFEWGANLDAATNEVRDAVGLAERNLPDDVEIHTNQPTAVYFWTDRPVYRLWDTQPEAFQRENAVLAIFFPTDDEAPEFQRWFIEMTEGLELVEKSGLGNLYRKK